MRSRVRLVTFDVDGVLVNVKSSWRFLHSYFGVEERAEEIRKMFQQGLIDYVKWMEMDTRLWIEARGGLLKRDEIVRALSQVKVEEEAVAAVRELKRRGLRVALVSSGLDLLVARVAEAVGAEVWMANKLSFDKRGYLLPGGFPTVGARKDRAVRLLSSTLGITLEETMYVGDSEFDAAAMRVVGYSVAYRDEGSLRGAARFRVERLGELVELVDCLEAGGDCSRFFYL
ncbi:MAG: HAD-IB family phosphatase [Acidilobaceae archaeon]|nr:HAD-IB family phosphatase [Acidilobaceae archaeon]